MTAIRVGIIGAGYWGTKLLRVFGSVPGARVQVVCERDAQRRATIADGIARVATAEALLERADVDVVVVATPPSTHYSLADAALAAGKHCWVEKPLALTAADARDLVEQARRRGLTLFVDETFLYDPLLQRAREWIRAGRLGRLFHVSLERLGMGRIRRDSDVWWNSGPHDLAILLYLVERAVETIRVDRFHYVQERLADVATATITLDDGISAHLYLSWLSPVKAASVVVVGSEGMLHYEGRFDQRAVRLTSYALGEAAASGDNVVPITARETETIVGGAEEPLVLAAAAFVQSVRTGIPAPSAGEYSQLVVSLLEAGAPARFEE